MKVQKDKLSQVLNEETLDTKLDAEEQEAVEKANKLLDDPTIVEDEGQIEKALNAAYAYNLRENRHGGSDFNNLLFVGPAGTAKTSRIKAWARAHNINLVTVLASVMDETDLGGAISPDSKDSDVVKRLSTTEFDELDASVDDEGTPNAVLFLDEFNRAPRAVRGTLLSLINDHTIRDDRVRGKQRKLKNFLFTVAAINDDDGNYNVDSLDDAEMSRFEEIPVLHDKNATLRYIHKKLQSYVDDGIDDSEEELNLFRNQMSLAETILKSPKLKFDSPQDVQASKESGNGKILTGRTFTMTILKCDGTKEGLLDLWDRYCNSMKKTIVAGILEDWQPIDDKANQLVQDGNPNVTEPEEDDEDPFTEHEDDWTKIAGALGL